MRNRRTEGREIEEGKGREGKRKDCEKGGRGNEVWKREEKSERERKRENER